MINLASKKAADKSILSKWSSAVGFAAVLLYLIIILSFISYFVILNNPLFILYSFIIFIIFAFILAFLPDFIEHMIALSIIFIISSAIIYSGMVAYIALYSLVAFAVLATALKFELFGKYKFYIFLAAFLPILFYILKLYTYQDFIINIAIVGYYLLISTVFGILIGMAIGEKKITKISTRISKNISSHKKPYSLAALFIAVIILFYPFWPVNYQLMIGNIPYATMHIDNNYSGLIYITFNPKNFSSFENYNLNNIRFFSNGKELNAYISPESNINNISQFILNTSASDINVYFFPYNTTFNETLKQLPNKEFLDLKKNSTTVYYNISAIVNANYKNVNKTLNYSILQLENGSKKTKMTISPYYLPQTLCPEANISVFKLQINSTMPISLFLMNSTKNFSKAIAGVPADYNNYLSSFMNESYRSKIGFTNWTINMTKNPNCVYYTIITNTSTNVTLKEDMSYYIEIQMHKVVSNKLGIINPGKGFTYGPIFESIPYLIQVYTNATANTT